MANHGVAVGAVIGPVTAGKVLAIGVSCEYPTMGVRTRKYVVLVIRPIGPDTTIHQFALLIQRCLSID